MISLGLLSVLIHASVTLLTTEVLGPVLQVQITVILFKNTASCTAGVSK